MDTTRGEGQSSRFYPPKQAGAHQRPAPQAGFGGGIGSQAAEACWIEIEEVDHEIYYRN